MSQPSTISSSGGASGDTGGKKVLTEETIAPGIKNVTYGIKGAIFQRSGQLVRELEQGALLPFDEVIFAGLGDFRAFYKEPITFFNQVMALIMCPQLMDSKEFPDDAKERAAHILKQCRGKNFGSGTDYTGLEGIRKNVARFLQERDSGVPANHEDIILSNGSSTLIKLIMSLFGNSTEGKQSGVIIPIPQYPIFSACIQEYMLYQMEYQLEESRNWSINFGKLRQVINKGRQFCKPRAIVVINPGNPTGQVLSREDIQNIIRFAYDEGLVIIADEVYQETIFSPDHPFHSFKKVMHSMDFPYNKVELCSLMSGSKGFTFQCGLRAGVMELVNFDPYVRGKISMLLQTQICPNITGQVAVDICMNPPRSSPSSDCFNTQKSRLVQGLARKAKIVCGEFQKMNGIECGNVQSGFYVFPKVKLPRKAVEEAKRKGMDVDTFYALQMLETTGVSVNPGSDFGQEPGTHHFRFSFIQPEDKLLKALKLVKGFHESFLQKYEEDD